jgi:hypothetical protein
MPVTFAAQIAPRNHRVFGERYCGWLAKENGSDHVVGTAAVRMHALGGAQKSIVMAAS